MKPLADLSFKYGSDIPMFLQELDNSFLTLTIDLATSRAAWGGTIVVTSSFGFNKPILLAQLQQLVTPCDSLTKSNGNLALSERRCNFVLRYSDLRLVGYCYLVTFWPYPIGP